MESCASDINSECLVTDLVHELSSGLEIPFLLSEDIKTVNKQENVSPLDNRFYEESLKDDWPDEVYFNQANNCESGVYVKNEIIDDLQSYLDESIRTQTSSFSGSGNSNGSGSECSSTEIWVSKNEFDTPPVTPPDERISPDSVFILPPEDFRFMPIKVDDNSPNDADRVISTCKTVRIQPKPLSTTVNIVDTHNPNSQAVLCNVFSDMNSNSIKNQNGLLESQIFLNLNNDKKKSVLGKKDLELLQAKRKQERMIRNRESAYLSRKRKKEHVAHLEKQVQDLLTENNQLRLENCSLRQRLAKYEKVEPLPLGKSKNIFTESPRKTTAVLALLFTVCLNIGSFSSFLNERRGFQGENISHKENIVPVYSNEMRHTRSLLWADEFENLNSTFANLTKTSCPVFINQSESIRLESELRRWIRGDEDYSRPSKHNISKISQYFYSGEKTHRRGNASKRKQKARSRFSNHRKENLEMNMYQMKPNLFNIESFFEAIHRRDDTFYLVSFSSDHLLLPALSHNKTSRPKMSLMLPAFLSNDTGADQVEMMQIDCEVTNTQLLSVNENNIPSHMRPYINSTSHHKNTNETKSEFFVAENVVPGKRHKFETENVKESQNERFPLAENKQNPKAYFNFSWIGKSNLEKKELVSVKSKKEADGIFTNQTQDQDTDLTTGSGKNLLKSLIVGPTNAKGVEYKSRKISQKDFKNGTSFLYN